MQHRRRGWGGGVRTAIPVKGEKVSEIKADGGGGGGRERR